MNTTMITGADGHIGKALANWLLTHSNDELLLLVRRRDPAHGLEKIRSLGTLAGDARCRIEFVELTGPDPFAGITPQGINRIIHSAAVTSFAVNRQDALEVNVEGTRKLVEFAGQCPDLQRFCFISSLYTAGLRQGIIDETVSAEEPEFANFYEWSKWRAEQTVVSNADLPWHIYRVATIIGEDDSGRVVQQNAIHNTLRLLYYGLLSVVPGEPDTRVYLASTEFVVNAIGALLNNHSANGVFHVCESGAEAVRLSEVIDIVYETFSRDDQFSRKNILKPLFCDRKSFDTLMSAVATMGSVALESLHSVAPFAPQLYSDKELLTRGLERTLPECQPSCTRALLSAVAEQLVETRWGLRQPEAMAS
jgi:nucleoside-diphosphate-sugar epimerase